MTFYAYSTARRTRQILADVLAVLWIATWVWVGRQVHDTVLALRSPADAMTSAGTTVHDSLTGAGDTAHGVPLVGDQLEGWLDQAAGSGTTLREAGTSMAGTVENLALTLGLTTALVPVLIVGGVWIMVRVRFIRRATSSQRFIDATADLDLFALRAMARRPMTELARIHPDPAGAWRRGDTRVIHALAALELKEEGLRPPTLLLPQTPQRTE
ncbi:MAG: hypothetical protein L0H96_24585 [Humibacillus sp.]|nr:hypothetical protein [Humibacillus sp.]MDN5780060.1 hypothetical protein [Humibacillus sp.]